jgi:regulatory protein
MFPKKYSKEQIILKLEAYCAYQERSLFEIETKLASLDSSPTDFKSIIAHLSECNFFNQERFAISFAIGKFRNNKWGKQKIKAGLFQKKISANLIAKALSSINLTDYKAMAQNLYEKKWLSLKSEKNEFERKQKTLRYLQSKGFEYDEISDFI